MSMSSIQRQHALNFIAHMNSREYQALADLMSESFAHRFLPASLKGMGMPVRNKQQFLDHVKGLEMVFQCFNVSSKSLAVLGPRTPYLLVPGSNGNNPRPRCRYSSCEYFRPSTIVMSNWDFQLVTDGKTASGKPYNNEYMFTFRFEGEKIVSVKEFMDSKYVTYMLEAEQNTTSRP